MTIHVDLTLSVPSLGPSPVTIKGTITDTPDERPNTVAEWLGHVDPEQLELVALSRQGFDSESSFASTMLAVLRHWASGSPTE